MSNDKDWDDRIGSNDNSDTTSRFGTQSLNEGSRFGTDEVSKGFGTKPEFFTENNLQKKNGN